MPERTEHLPDSLQEAVLAVLALDDRYGPVVAGQVRPEHFDGQFRDAAAAVLAYHNRYRKAPGEAQLLPVLAAGREGERTAGARRLAGRLVAQFVTINAAYVVSRTAEFVRQQTLTAAVAEATERLIAGGEEGLVTDVETILRTALDARRTVMEAGTFLSDATRGLQFLDRAREGYRLGIAPLDRAGVGLTPKEMLLYVAGKNTGKSWFCVHCGRQALMQGAKVVHLTLEMEDTLAIGRYHQSLFGAGWTADKTLRAELEFDDLDRLTGFKTKRVRPKMSLSDPGARRWLRERIQHWGTRLGRLVVREFPSGTLTMPVLEGYLDYLDAVHKFVPHVLVVDYPDLMSVPLRDFRLGLGRLYVDLRGLAQRRNLAVVAPTQGNRSSLQAAKVHADQTSEDISKVFTADTVLTYSQTEAESRMGLARLHVDYARNAARGQTVLLTQSYATGQYVLQSALMQKIYWDRLDEMAGTPDKGEDDDDTRRRR
jgi:hypothetical protein